MNKIWVKLSAVTIVVVLLLMAVVFYFFTRRQIKTEREELQANMERIAMQIASIRLTNTEDLIVYQEWIKRILDSEAGEGLVYIAIFDQQRRDIVAHALNTEDLGVEDAQFLTPEEEVEVIKRLMSGQVAEESWNDFDHVPVEIRSGTNFLGKVDVGFSLIDFNNKVQRKLLMNIYILLSAFVAVVVLSILMGKRITKPLDLLSTAMLDVSKGNYDSQVDIRSGDEIGDLSRTFNYMTKRLREKSAIEDFSRDLVFSVESSKLVQVVTERIVRYMGATQGALFLVEENGAQTSVASLWGYPNRLVQKIKVDLDEQCQAECLQRSEPFSPDILTYRESFETMARQLRLQVDFECIDLIAPLVSQGETLGFLLLAPEQDRTGYDPDEQMFLRTLCHQAGMAIRNSFLLRELAEQERLQRELEIARSVQQSLLPLQEPQIDGVNILGLCIPAAEVGGDYYDYFQIDAHRIGIAIADVSGKGTSAAFYMAEIKGMMTSLTHLIASPKELMRQINRHLNKNVDKRVFTTMIYGVLDVRNLEFTFVRAGHNALLVKRAEKNGELDIYIPHGMGLGLVNDEVFRECTQEEIIRFNHGDFLLLYTDGISEAMNNKLEEFGEERLYTIMAQNHILHSQDLQHRIMRQVGEFVQDAQQHDDITMVIAQFE